MTRWISERDKWSAYISEYLELKKKCKQGNMKILRLYALVDIARYQSNFSEWEGKKVRWERVVVVVWDQGIAFFYMISEDYFLNIPEKSYKDVNNIWYNVQ